MALGMALAGGEARRALVSLRAALLLLAGRQAATMGHTAGVAERCALRDTAVQSPPPSLP